MDARAILTRQAFQGLFASAYGLLNVETTGFLAGERKQRRTRRDFVAEMAQACQKTARQLRRASFSISGVIFSSHYYYMKIL